jgi:4-hydroxyproline epimerase
VSTISFSVIDSHTGGEPTRVVIEGGPDLGTGSMADRLKVFRTQHDGFRKLVNREPRGNDILVSALLCEPQDPANDAGVIFFNNVGYLGMCGHGSIGLVRTLAWMKRVRPGHVRIETPVGTITATLHENMSVTINNVPSYRLQKAVTVDVPGIGAITGDIAWGGNWFFLVSEHGQTLRYEHAEHLTDFTWKIRQALESQHITGKDGALIDHIELFADCDTADSINFVLCPGKAYDRSPCGTGTSAKMACLAEDGKLEPGTTWRQAGILNTVFEGSYQWDGDVILPSISSEAFIMSEGNLVLEDQDPFQHGIG